MMTEQNVIALKGLNPETIIKVLNPALIEENDYFFLKQYFKDLGWSSVVDINKQMVTGSDTSGNKFRVEKFVDKYSYTVTKTVRLKHDKIKNDKEYPFWVTKGNFLFLEIQKRYPNGDTSGLSEKDDYKISFNESGVPYSKDGMEVGFYVETNKGSLFFPYYHLVGDNGILINSVKYNIIWES